MSLQVLTAPAALPIDIDEARTQLRQDSAVDDFAISGVIRACTTYAQTTLRRSLIAQRLTLTLDSFCDWTLLLEYGPVLAIRGITYLDMAGVRQTVPTSDYATADLANIPSRIAPAFGKVWPASLPQIGAVEVTFDAGDAARITVSGNTFTIKGGIWRPLAVGDTVRLSCSGGPDAALPAPLALDTDYFVQSTPTATSFTLAETLGGAVISIAGPGTGTFYIGAVDEGIRTWMKLRMSTLYDAGGDVLVIPRGTLEPLPYADRLLDGLGSDLR